MLGIDATFWIPGKAIKDAGYEWVGRYCLRGAYRITSDEVADYRANGLAIEFFGEHDAGFMLGGGPAGTDAGRDAHDWLNHLGAPAGTAVFFTVDFDANQSQLPALGAFLQAAQVQLAEYQAGIYGGLKVINAFGSTYPTHQTEAWSYGEVSPYANFFQRVGTTLPPIAGTQPGQYDENLSINAEGLWWSGIPPTPPKPPQTEDDSVISIIYDGVTYHVWAFDGKVKYRPIKQGTPGAIATATGTYQVDMTNPRPLVAGPFIYFPSKAGQEIIVAPYAYGLTAKVI